MTDQEILEYYDKLVEFYGPELPHPEYLPQQFAYLVKLYRYYVEKKGVNYGN